MRHVASRLRGLVLVTHPVPSAMYVVATLFCALLASAAAHRSPSVPRLALVLLAVACAEIATGALNDYRDRELDTAGKRDKPIVRGLIAPWHAVALSLVATLVLVAALLPLGWGVLLLGLVIEGLGLAYDFGLKGTVLSALLFAVYFPLFPLLAWAVFGRWQPFLPWLLPLGAALGIAMNVANTLPDLDADRAAGMRGLPHLLGLHRGLLVAWGTPLLAVVFVWALHGFDVVPAHPLPLLAGSAFVVASVALALLLYRRRPTAATLRRTFLAQALGILGLAAGWLAAVAF
jgi:4-hydroxybenzoate polyprenyltransferase